MTVHAPAHDDSLAYRPLPPTPDGLRHIGEILVEHNIPTLSPDYRELRDSADRMFMYSEGTILIFRHQDLKRLGSNPAVGNVPHDLFVQAYLDSLPGGPLPASEFENFLRLQKNQFFTTVPDVHARVKKMFAMPLMPREMPPYQDMTEAIADRLIQEKAGTGEIDLIGDLTAHIATGFWAELLGMTETERLEALRAVELFSPVTSFQNVTPEGMRLFNDVGIPAFWRALVPAIVRAREAGTRPFINRMADQFAALERDSDYLPESHEMFMACNMVDAFHAVGVAAGVSIYHLLLNPDAFAEVRADPTLAPAAVNEALRLSTPVQAITRGVLQDIDYDGMHIPAGTSILMYWAVANRDSDVHEHADKFDLHRPLKPPATFGTGAQICPGRNIAHTIATATVRAFAKPGISIELTGDAQWSGPAHAPPTLLTRVPVRIALD